MGQCAFSTDLTANRLDNTICHTLENIEPCCSKCNARLSNTEGFDKKSKEPNSSKPKQTRKPKTSKMPKNTKSKKII